MSLWRSPIGLVGIARNRLIRIAFRYIKRALLKLGTSYIDGWMGDGWRMCMQSRKKWCIFNIPHCEKWSEWVKWSEWSEWSNFWVFDFYETFICYRGCLNLNCYIVKKVQKKFLMGFKIWWSWGSRFFFSKSP